MMAKATPAPQTVPLDALAVTLGDTTLSGDKLLHALILAVTSASAVGFGGHDLAVEDGLDTAASVCHDAHLFAELAVTGDSEQQAAALSLLARVLELVSANVEALSYRAGGKRVSLASAPAGTEGGR